MRFSQMIESFHYRERGGERPRGGLVRGERQGCKEIDTKRTSEFTPPHAHATLALLGSRGGRRRPPLHKGHVFWGAGSCYEMHC
jgi:hypothetical protein